MNVLLLGTKECISINMEERKMRIYDKSRIRCRTFIESINSLFCMGRELENKFDSIGEGAVLTAEDGYYNLAIDDTSSSITLIDKITYYTIRFGGI